MFDFSVANLLFFFKLATEEYKISQNFPRGACPRISWCCTACFQAVLLTCKVVAIYISLHFCFSYLPKLNFKPSTSIRFGYSVAKTFDVANRLLEPLQLEMRMLQRLHTIRLFPTNVD